MPETVPGQHGRAYDPLHAPPALPLALARAVAAPSSDALLIGADNRAARRRLPIDVACRTDRCFAVKVHPRLVAVDLDATDATAAAVSATVEQLADAAAAAGVPHLVCDSGTGWHIYFVVGRLPRRTRTALEQTVGAYGDVRSGTARIRPPGVRHRRARDTSGAVARVRPVHATLDVALATLQGRTATLGAVDSLIAALRSDLPVQTAPVTLLRPRVRRPLPRALVDLADGPMPPAGSRSEPDFAIRAAVVRAGWSEDEWVTFARSRWLGTYAAVKQPGAPVRRLRRQYQKAALVVASTDPSVRRHTDDADLAGQLRHQLVTSPGVRARWWRDGGHALVDALLELVAALGTRTVHLSVRDAAEAIGRSKSAAHRHLVACEQAGLVARADPAPGLATVVTVHLDAVRQLVAEPGGGAGAECPTSGQEGRRRTVERLLATRAADVFSWRGANHGCWRTFVAWWGAGGQPPDPAALGVSRTALSRQLGRLHTLGLLGAHDDDVLEQAAITAGVAGVGAIRRALHADDRARFEPIAAAAASTADSAPPVAA